MGDFNPAHRETYTSSQIQAYYARIGLPSSEHHTPDAVSKIANTAAGLDFLTKLQKYQLAAIPFENLELHYSSHHTITLDPQHLFHKIVERDAGRGGYCMENSNLFGTVLRSLGYDVVSIGAKVNEAAQPMSAKKGWKGPKYDGWNHMLNIVTISGTKYMLDVGFGSAGPVHPLPLHDAEIHTNVGAQQTRLLYAPVPDFTSGQKLWHYQHRNSPSQDWIPTYAFSEMEFTPSDFEMMNFFTSTHRSMWFRFMVVCVRMVMREGEIVGDVTLFGGEVKRRIGGVSEVLAVCGGEGERVQALREFLGVRLSETEVRGIRGLQTELLDA